ncbi:hypothetical protein ABEZ21_23930 [Brevibacillus porteri]|nr:hypothetical protein [Brevibacillus porteri]MED2748757.1 hypothetical protein [Brevibacillus porteri]MED2818413.1 hypothetical protein [Brevibacillus porteri]MED4899567.1 hypothetical protein [Brevibacillus porteri]
MDYQIETDLITIPKSGEYLYLSEHIETGLRAFLVRNVFHQGKMVKEGKATIESIILEVEFIEHPLQSESHKQSVEMYKARGYKVKEALATAY